MIATGTPDDGGREILGVDLGDPGDETFRTRFLRSLGDRGLGGVRLVFSDAHAELNPVCQGEVRHLRYPII